MPRLIVDSTLRAALEGARYPLPLRRADGVLVDTLSRERAAQRVDGGGVYGVASRAGLRYLILPAVTATGPMAADSRTTRGQARWRQSHRWRADERHPWAGAPAAGGGQQGAAV